MKRKKQLKIILAILTALVIVIGGWLMLTPGSLSAKEAPKTPEVRTGSANIPEPPNPDAVNVQENFSFVKDAKRVTDWTNTVRMFPNTLGASGALWYKDPISLDKDFSGDFAIYFGDEKKPAYDGVTLTLQNDPRMKTDPTKVIGYTGAGLGLSGGIPSAPATAVNPAIAVVFNPGEIYNWNTNTKPADQKKPSVSVAIPHQDDYTLLYIHNSSQTRGTYPNYNLQYSSANNTTGTYWLGNGKWLKVSFKWDKKNQELSYRVGKFLDDKTSQTDFSFTDMGEWQTVKFGNGETSGTVVPDTASKNIPALNKSAKDYFGSDMIYWGFTGSNNASPPAFAAGESLDPIVSIGLTPNQSQSPLQLSMHKFGEINSGTKERAPLEGAEFILQAKDKDNNWKQFNPEPEKNIPLTFKTNKQGNITIAATEGKDPDDPDPDADLIALVLKYGGLKDYQAFRFREVAAPEGYVQPPAIDTADPDDYSKEEPDISAVWFATEPKKLSGHSMTIVKPEYDENGVLTNKDKIKDDGYFGTVFNSLDTWLPYYKPGLGIDEGGWQDSMESYIPRKNAFVMRYSKSTKYETKVDKAKSSDNLIEVAPTDPAKDSGLISFDFDKGPGVVWIDNIGFEKGHPLSVKVTMTVDSDKTYDQLKAEYPTINRWFGLNTKSTIDYYTWNTKPVDQFLGIFNSFKFKSFNVQYEVYDDEGKKIDLGAYQTYDALDEKKILTLQKDDFENIYSVSREYKDGDTRKPILLKYTDELDKLIVRSNDLIVGEPGSVQNQFSATIKDLSGSGFTTYDSQKGYDTDTNYQVWYIPETPVKVEIPDPQEMEKTYTKIIAKNQGILEDKKIEDMIYGFYQYMPWEATSPKNQRTQTMDWVLTPPKENDTFTITDWQVEALDNPDLNGGDISSWFPIAGNKVTPPINKLTEDEFYHHYYQFNQGLKINYSHPIAKDVLKPKDGGYYYQTYETDDADEITSGKVDIDVIDSNATDEQKEGMNKNRKGVKYNTAINFLAPITYKFVDKDGNEIQTDAEGQGVVTWNAPLSPRQLTESDYNETSGQGDAPNIPGYQFSSAKLNGQDTDWQIKQTHLLKDNGDAKNADDYTKNNVVTLTYERKALTLSVEPNLYFKRTTVPLPSGANQTIERDAAKDKEGVNWTVTVNGSGVPAGEKGYKVKAQLLEEFTDKTSTGNKGILTNILYFKNDKNGSDTLLTAGGAAVELFNSDDEQANNSMTFPFEKTWDNTTGFYLNLSFAKSLDIYGNIVSKGPTATSATYTAPIEVSLDYLPED